MIKELQDLINVLNTQVEFFNAGLQTEEELTRNANEILRFYFKKYK